MKMTYCLILLVLMMGCTQPPTTNALPENAIDGKTTFGFAPAVSIIEGKLHVVTHYGPPSFGAEPELDLQTQYLILQLKNPIDILEVGDNPSKSLTTNAIQNVDQVQIDPNGMPIAKYKGLKIALRGQFTAARDTNAPAPAILHVESYKEL